MIGFLRGQVLELSSGQLVLGVGTPPDVGYLLTIGESSPLSKLQIGERTSVHVHTHVREDALDLYGFSTREEKELFLILLKCSGIGPKGAVGILSRVRAEDLIRAILNGDKSFLNNISGIGKKTAEKIVIDLSDLLQKKVDSGLFSTAQVSEGLGLRGGSSGGLDLSKFEDEVVFGAKQALVGLGYKDSDAKETILRVLKKAERPSRVEDLVKLALQQV